MVVQVVAGFLKIMDLQRDTITISVSCTGQKGFVSMSRSHLFSLNFATVALSWSNSVCTVITLRTRSPRRRGSFPRCKKMCPMCPDFLHSLLIPFFSSYDGTISKDERAAECPPPPHPLPGIQVSGNVPLHYFILSLPAH